LRCDDNPTLAAALAREEPVVALYVLDDETPGRWRLGGASLWWLHHSLKALEERLHAHGIALCLRRGRASEIVPEIAQELGAGAIFWCRQYEPYAIKRDTALKKSLSTGAQVKSFNGALLFEPGTITKPDGTPYSVFTPFWRAAQNSPAPAKPIK